jgi:hypothetical protein
MNPQEARSSPGSDPELPAGAACWTPERLALKAWLSRHAPSLAELYEGAVCLLFERRLAGYTRFVGHAVREIGNRLPDVISEVSTFQLQYKSRLDSILQKWKKAGLTTDGTFPAVTMASDSARSKDAQIALPLGLARSIATLIGDHEAARERPRERARRLFAGIRPEIQIDAVRPALTQWLEVTDWFMAITHDSHRVDGVINDAQLQAKFALFETALLAIAQPFFTTTDALDEILEEANS